jgi:hypothetical protein
VRKAARFICFSVLADELVGVTRGKDEKLEKNEKNEKKMYTKGKRGRKAVGHQSVKVVRWFGLV